MSIVNFLILLLTVLQATASTRTSAAYVNLPAKNRLSFTAPPEGAIYQTTIPIPILGTQSFRLHILGNDQAHLLINGVLRVDEILSYQVRPGGAFSLLIPETLKQVLRRFRTKLVEFGYNHETDLPYVVVRPPLPTNLRIELSRSYIEQ